MNFLQKQNFLRPSILAGNNNWGALMTRYREEVHSRTNSVWTSWTPWYNQIAFSSQDDMSAPAIVP